MISYNLNHKSSGFFVVLFLTITTSNKIHSKLRKRKEMQKASPAASQLHSNLPILCEVVYFVQKKLPHISTFLIGKTNIALGKVNSKQFYEFLRDFCKIFYNFNILNNKNLSKKT
jgi:hypothetical protein